jgi:hypothetical protein
MNRTLHSLFFFTQLKNQSKIALVFFAFCLSFSSIAQQAASESVDLRTEKKSATQNKFGAEQIALEAIPDPSIVFADSNFRFTYNHSLLHQLLTPFPIQVSESGDIINYSTSEWEGILSRLSEYKEIFDFEKFKTQFLTSSMDFINLGRFEHNVNPLIVQPWLVPYLNEQLSSQMEYTVKSQYLLGNICILDGKTGLPSTKNISTKGLPKGSPNAMLAYTSLVNRWLFAKPNFVKEFCKTNNLSVSIFSDPKLLCTIFAPELLPEAIGKKSR